MVVEMLKEGVASERKGVITERIAKLRASIIGSDVVHDTERIKILMQIYRETHGEPLIIRRAKLFDRVMTEKTIYIDENPIVGTIGRGRNYYYSFPEYSFEWIAAMASCFQSHKKATVFIEEDNRSIDDAVEYWYERCPVSISARIWDETHQQGPVFKTLFSNESFSCLTTLLDWSVLLKYGLNWRIARAEKILQMLKLWGHNDPKTREKYDFYRAVIIALEAVIKNANRYAALATKMARKETNTEKRQELLRIAEACQWIPANPPRNFYEAAQFHWFIIAASLIEEAACGTVFKGFPLYMYPFYKKDIDRA